jgi:hypothetical protein
MTAIETQSSSFRAALRRAVGAPLRVQTYTNLAYLLLAFPLGIVYFTGFVTGTALGIGLLITLVGLPILVATLAATSMAAALEARLATALVGVEASVPAALREFGDDGGLVMPGNGFLAAVKRVLVSPSTYTSVLLVLSKFVFGIVSLIAVVVSLSVSLVALAAPAVYDGDSSGITLGGEATDQYTVGSWVIDTMPEALLVAGGGAVFLVIALNALNLLAWLQAEYTARLLSVDGTD